MNFTKMHGIGNDFILINCLDSNGESLRSEARDRSIELCDRKFGIGADGIILILPGSSTEFRMQMFNPDGSEAEMCGNGIRCFANYLYENDLVPDFSNLNIETGAGTLIVKPELDGAKFTGRVTVDMGPPILDPKLIPTTLGTASVINEPLELLDRTVSVTAISMGNPHAVVFVETVENYPVQLIGQQVENHGSFPNRTNTEFIEVLSRREMNFRVWERGAGETLACGTGACASVVASSLNGLTDRDVTVHLRGGDLQIRWSESDNHVYMTGAAETVYTGAI